MLKERFVPVAIDAMFAAKQDDAEGEFLRENNCMVRTSSGAGHVITAEGKILGGRLGFSSLQKALAAWEALPEEERKPGAVAIGKLGPRDPKAVAMTPPEGGLILRVANRHLARTDKGELRYLAVEDFLTEKTQRSASRYREPSNDFMWVPKEEWQALLPKEPKVGDRFPVPQSFAVRLFRYHLNPLLGIRGAMCFTNSAAESGQLTVVVEEVADRVRLRLEGSARLTHSLKMGVLSYEPAFLGYLEYDRASRKVHRFDLVALGNLDGSLPALGGGPMSGFPSGVRPFGVAFELILDPAPAEKLRPHGARQNVARYLMPLKK